MDRYTPGAMSPTYRGFSASQHWKVALDLILPDGSPNKPILQLFNYLLLCSVHSVVVILFMRHVLYAGLHFLDHTNYTLATCGNVLLQIDKKKWSTFQRCEVEPL